MSAPTTHDPRFVNTRDGVCWERRAVTDSRLGLYAVEGSCKCPPFKMATFVELAAHGIVEWADELPRKVGTEPQPLSAERLAQIEARVSEATAGPWCADAWEIYQGAEYEPGISPWIGETCRGTSTPEQDRADAEFVAHAREDVPALVAEVRRLRGALSETCGQVAGLESELGGASAALSDTAVRMRADAVRIAELEGANSAAVAVSETLYRTLTDEKLAGSALYAALTQPTTSEQRQAALDRFLAVAQRSGQMHGPSAPDAVTQSFAPVAALREVLDGEHFATVHHDYRVGHDLPEGCRLSEEQVRELGNPFFGGGA